jgi:hypothetical protein
VSLPTDFHCGRRHWVHAAINVALVTNPCRTRDGAGCHSYCGGREIAVRRQCDLRLEFKLDNVSTTTSTTGTCSRKGSRRTTTAGRGSLGKPSTGQRIDDVAAVVSPPNGATDMWLSNRRDHWTVPNPRQWYSRAAMSVAGLDALPTRHGPAQGVRYKVQVQP